MTDLLKPIKDQIAKLWTALDGKPVMRWGTVFTASPLTVLLDPGMGDPAPARSAAGSHAVGDRVYCAEQNRRVVITGTGSIGPVPLTLEPGILGTATYQKVGQVVEIVVDVTPETGTFSADDFLIAALPVDHAPAVGIRTTVSWIDPPGTGIGYVNQSGNIRHGRATVEATRIRFAVTYLAR